MFLFTILKDMSQERLTDKILIKLIREVYDERRTNVREELDVMFPIGGNEKNVLSKGLKIRDKKGKMYVVDSIGDWGAILNPAAGEGDSRKVTIDELESGYEL